jgi:tripartite-type tricarboxylate transporter receptor subunit TctC
MRILKRIFLVLVCLCLSLGFSGAAFGEFPEKPVRIIVPYGPGGISDLTARTLSSVIGEYLGRPLAVVNKPGGGGVIGGHFMTQGKPGYTMAIFAPVLAFPEIYRPDAAYTSANIRPVCRQFMMLTTLFVRKDAPPNNIKEFVAWVKKNPGMKYGHTGRGATTHMVSADLADLVGLNLKDLPFQGDTKVVSAVLGGHVPIGFANLPGVISHIKAGTVKALGIYADKRIPEAGQVATFGEQGYKLRLPYPFGGLFVPRASTDQQVDILDRAVGQASQHKSYLKLMGKIGAYVAYMPRPEFEAELNTYQKVAREFMKKMGLQK